jgi:predicted ATP-binding protein involved in virulence
VAFAALATRVLWAAYPDQDPRQSEGVVTIDDVELHQDTPVLSRLASALREALPAAQWILTTASPVLAASSAVSDVVALRRLRESDSVAVFAGEQALTH